MLMSGSWHIYRPGERWQQPRRNMRIVIETADFQAVAFSVPVAKMHTAASLLGATPIFSAADRDVLRCGIRTCHRRRPPARASR